MKNLLKKWFLYLYLALYEAFISVKCLILWRTNRRKLKIYQENLFYAFNLTIFDWYDELSTSESLYFMKPMKKFGEWCIDTANFWAYIA